MVRMIFKCCIFLKQARNLCTSYGGQFYRLALFCFALGYGSPASTCFHTSVQLWLFLSGDCS